LKFAHIADTHIKNLKFHYEYGIVFEKLYEILREEKVDYIIHCGDIAHTKTQISPEFVEMCTRFFRNLAEIAPTYIILGNHDGNLKNSSRQDALSPIAEALEHPRLHLLKNSGETLLGDSVAINVLSVFDEDNWISPTNPEKINIALYHGSISGVTTDTGWVMTHGEHPIEIFEGHDYAFLGDIHKTNQCLDVEGKIRYCGSTVQQNHGETNDKGFLLWDIEDKDTFTCRHVELKNPRPFVTINLTPKGKMPKGAKIPEKSRLRLVSNNNLPLNVMKRALEVAKRRFKPESISFLNRAAGERGDVQAATSGLMVEDLRDLKIQEKLIKEYLKDYELESDLQDSVIGLNAKYNKLAEENEEIARNINWKLRSLEFDNLFNYGESNSIDFENIEGIVGIFGKNYSGKSSIIDALLYTLFNSTSKNDRKNLNVINQNKEGCFGRANISIGDLNYTIERSSKKYVKKLKGVTTMEASTNADFSVYCPIDEDNESLNGNTRNETDKNIRKVFGTLEDFLYSSMASQLDSLSFIKEGSTKRKEILAKFLDLQFFERKFKLAKEDAAATRGAIRKLEDRDFNKEILDARMDLGDAESSLDTQRKSCEKYKETITSADAQIFEIEAKINAIPAHIIDVVKVRSALLDRKTQLRCTRENMETLAVEKKKFEKDYADISSFLEKYDRDSLYGKKAKLDELKSDISKLSSSLEGENAELERNTKKVKLLDGIPCSTDLHPKCKFIKDAYNSKALLPVNEERITGFENSISSIEAEVEEIGPRHIEETIQGYLKIVAEQNNLSNRIANHGLKIEKDESGLENLHNEIEKLEKEVEEYEENKEAIENLELLNSQLSALRVQRVSCQTKSDKCTEKILNLYKSVGSLEEKVKNLKLQQESYTALQEEFSAYDLYMQCMHPNGIAFDVIRKKLPVINEEIAKILANIVDFEVFFEDDGKRLEIYIKHPLFEPRPLQMGSGAEKTIAAMAIRLALLSVSSLPKGDIFILDEPGTALDEENMQGFIDILAIIKTYFRKVLLISHLDSLKDCVDMQISIDKKDGYASVNI
jgi:DNA repair exonuclease SbcCD ATPase subunit/DNA repair exonuclease SbcCD nuclease subunit